MTNATFSSPTSVFFFLLLIFFVDIRKKKLKLISLGLLGARSIDYQAAERIEPVLFSGGHGPAVGTFDLVLEFSRLVNSFTGLDIYLGSFKAVLRNRREGEGERRGGTEM